MKAILKYGFTATNFLKDTKQMEYMEIVAKELGLTTQWINKDKRVLKISKTIFKCLSPNKLHVRAKTRDKKFINSICDNSPQYLTKLDTNMILKPNDRHGGRGVYVGDYLDIPEGYIAQKRIIGDVYKFFIVKGKILACNKQTTPKVIGDGVHTVEELARIQPISPPFKMPIVIGYENIRNYIPKKNEVVETHWIHGRKKGGIVTGVEVSEEMKRLAIDAFNKVEDLRVAGVDIMLDENNNLYLLEINSISAAILPYLYPLKKDDDVIREMLKILFKNKIKP